MPDILNLTEVKSFLRVDFNDDDKFITGLIDVAEQMIKEQTGVSFRYNDRVYKLAMMQAVAHFYDKRESFSEKSQVSVPYTLDCLIKHISMRGDYKNG